MPPADLTAVGEVLVDRVVASDHPGGSPLNVSLAASRLGLAVDLVGRVGADAPGEMLRAKAAESGIRLGSLVTASQPTSVAVSTLDEHGRAHYEFDFDVSAALAFTDAELEAVPLGRVLQTGSIAAWHPLSSGPVMALQRRAWDAGTLISFDPNPRPSLITDVEPVLDVIAAGVAQAHVVKASDEDLGVLFPGVEPVEIAASWCALGASLVLVTRGPEGAQAFTADGLVASVPAPRIELVDTVGAGDAFTGGFLTAICDADLATPLAFRAMVAERSPALVRAIEQAVLTSAITCERAGANPPTRAEFDARRLGSS
ncbi:MAG: carbohydrate kinase family protein [Jatrophihabitans sp.]|uniref:carbohydrate kinase family protein n=1 Tax=Jatrophihabitans sp. TaxID=1932789 RepID=UPI003F7FB445